MLFHPKDEGDSYDCGQRNADIETPMTVSIPHLSLPPNVGEDSKQCKPTEQPIN